MPALEALQDRFAKAHTQPLGISVDSIHSHANWARDLGGISFPLLADFHPKGAVAQSYGLYNDDVGITFRATVIIDADGIVRHASMAPQDGRDIAELAALAERIDAEYKKELPDAVRPEGLPPGVRLFIKSNCGFSRKVLLARTNLHIEQQLPVLNISEDAAAMAALEAATGKTQAPALMVGNTPMLESQEIVDFLRAHTVGF